MMFTRPIRILSLFLIVSGLAAGSYTNANMSLINLSRHICNTDCCCGGESGKIPATYPRSDSMASRCCCQIDKDNAPIEIPMKAPLETNQNFPVLLKSFRGLQFATLPEIKTAEIDRHRPLNKSGPPPFIIHCTFLI